MYRLKNRKRSTNLMTRLALCALVAAALSLSVAPASMAQAGQAILGNTPHFVAGSTVLNQEDPSKVIEITAWLAPSNRTEMDALAKDLYNPQSPNYRHFLSRAEIVQRFSPANADSATVTSFLESNGLKVVRFGPHNWYVRVSGTVGAIESALHVTLNNYQVRGNVIRANDSDPIIAGPAGALVRHIAGLDTATFSHPNAVRPTPPASHGAVSSVSGAVSSPADFFSNICFPGTKTETYTTGGTFPKATFTGNDYGGPSSGLGCGYTPDEIQTAFNLKALYQEGFDGTGQTIIILDWCGSPTITSDANAFSAKFGLPPLTSANFQIIQTPVPSTCAAPDPEINIDVEWAHAIAPGANIDLIVPPSASFQDVNEGEFYAVNYDLGNVFSGSYGSEEFFTSTAELETESLINEIAAIAGISTNFSTGDDGDDSFGGFEPTSVNAPADSPYATGIGGTTLALNSDNSIAWQTGWGNNITYLDITGEIEIPPAVLGLNGGAGGGPSGVFAKPSYQSALPGTARLLPDISWLADPFTGAVIGISEPFQSPALIYTVYGGTSLACPMFSGLWAIANQEANGGPLGQAAPYLYTLPAGTVTDILPYNNGADVAGTIQTTSAASSATYYHAWDLVGVPKSTQYLSALWDYPDNQDVTLLVSFGTDSSLTITKGWDNVTGVGVPNGKAFADYFFVPPPPPAATTVK